MPSLLHWLLLCLFGVACGPVRGTPSPSAKLPVVVLVASERASFGARLVLVQADGARIRELTTSGSGGLDGNSAHWILDRSPVYTPDGKHLVFVSNRRRSNPSQTNLWRISATGEGLQPLDTGAQSDTIDRDPRFSPDGQWLYFSSDRDGPFHLFRTSWADSPEGIALGPAIRITSGLSQDLSPSVSPDGTSVVYMAVDSQGNSRIFRAEVGGGSPVPIPLTDGPLDVTPTWSATGTIAFSAKRPGAEDAELMVMNADGSDQTLVVSAPASDETGPRWSSDGRYLFAIAMYRSATDGKPLLGSVVFVDTWEQTPSLRALHDPASVESRIGFALRPGVLDSTLLHKNAPYLEALERVLLDAVIENKNRTED